jgi:hypothetical protein
MDDAERERIMPANVHGTVECAHAIFLQRALGYSMQRSRDAQIRSGQAALASWFPNLSLCELLFTKENRLVL